MTQPFTDDYEKMKDFFQLSKEDWLKHYSYMTEAEYVATLARLVKARMAVFSADKAEFPLGLFALAFGRCLFVVCAWPWSQAPSPRGMLRGGQGGFPLRRSWAL